MSFFQERMGDPERRDSLRAHSMHIEAEHIAPSGALRVHRDLLQDAQEQSRLAGGIDGAQRTVSELRVRKSWRMDCVATGPWALP